MRKVLEDCKDWIEHWQRDREAGLMPTAESLANLHKAVTEALKLAPGMTFTQETKSPTLKDCIAINCGVGFDKRPPIDRAPIAADLPVDGDGFIDG